MRKLSIPKIIALIIMFIMLFLVLLSMFIVCFNVKTVTYPSDNEDVNYTDVYSETGWFVITDLPGDSVKVGVTVDLKKYTASPLTAEDKFNYKNLDLKDRPLLIDANGTVIQWDDLADDSGVGDYPGD